MLTLLKKFTSLEYTYKVGYLFIILGPPGNKGEPGQMVSMLDIYKLVVN